MVRRIGKFSFDFSDADGMWRRIVHKSVNLSLVINIRLYSS